MKTILDVVQEFRESDPPLTYLRQDESVAYGKFLEFEVVDWNGTTRIVPSEALHLSGRPATARSCTEAKPFDTPFAGLPYSAMFPTSSMAALGCIRRIVSPRLSRSSVTCRLGST